MGTQKHTAKHPTGQAGNAAVHGVNRRRAAGRGTTTAPATPVPAVPESVQNRAEIVRLHHAGIAALARALAEIDAQYACFSTTTARDYARTAIVDKLGAWCRMQSEAVEALGTTITTLGTAQVA